MLLSGGLSYRIKNVSEGKKTYIVRGKELSLLSWVFSGWGEEGGNASDLRKKKCLRLSALGGGLLLRGMKGEKREGVGYFCRVERGNR